MPSILKAAFAVVVGFVAWIAIGTVGNLLLRAVLPGYALALLLLVVFVPVHVGPLWSRFPVWYDATFLITLTPPVMLGFGLARARALKAG